MTRDPRYIELPLNDAGHYTTASGDIEHGTVEYVLGLLNTTVDNPNQTVSKGKLKHIAAQLLARNALVERANDVLRHSVLELQIEIVRLQKLANTTSVTIDTSKLSAENIRQIKELIELTPRGNLQGQ